MKNKLLSEPPSPEHWRRNLYVTWLVQVLSLSGFSISMPFLPFYVRSLGVVDPAAVKWWVGTSTAILSVSAAIMGPIWGVLADRHGRKIMILRSTLAGMIICALTGFAPNVEIFTLLRFVQGIFTGTIAAAAILVAAGTPKHRLSYALGFLASSTFIGSSIGPSIGGLLADTFGYRATYFVTAGVLGIAFLLALTLITDVKNEPHVAKGASFTHMHRIFTRTFIFVLVVIFLIRFAGAVAGPFVALRVEQLAQVKNIAGLTGFLITLRSILISVAGLTIVRLADRYNKIDMITLALLLAAALTFPIFFAGNIVMFAVFFIITGFFSSCVEPIMQSYVSAATDPKDRGLIFGTLSAVGSLGFFAAPIAGSSIAVHHDIKATFLAQAFLLLFTMLVIIVYKLRHIQFAAIFDRKKSKDIIPLE
ncbi:MAG: MFS transporter [Spirochaetes bacterium]|nr:MFS transporter [Spirochaetota bacterium]